MNDAVPNSESDPDGPGYSTRLVRLESARWKRWLDVQAPYRRHVRRLRLGKTLDVGCGIGRHLRHLDVGSVGIDRDPQAVAIARARGCTAYTVDTFRETRAQDFDSLLFSHVLEHLRFDDAVDLVRRYRPCLRPRGRVVLIAPQAAGQRSDPTHIELLDPEKLLRLARSADLEVLRSYSFPFPRFAGRFFVHNESVVVAQRCE